MAIGFKLLLKDTVMDNFSKCMDVLDSCKTSEQLNIAIIMISRYKERKIEWIEAQDSTRAVRDQDFADLAYDMTILTDGVFHVSRAIQLKEV